jgi:CheY-like chemotaxis protein
LDTVGDFGTIAAFSITGVMASSAEPAVPGGAAKSGKAEPAMQKRPDLSGVRILIADDELLCAMLLEEEVEDLGGKVVGTVSRIGDIVETAKRENAEIAVLDVNMEGRRSYGAAVELVQAGVLVVFTSGYNTLIDCPDALKAAPLLTKPWTGDVLGTTLSGALARKKS